jgi:hypothetical protein
VGRQTDRSGPARPINYQKNKKKKKEGRASYEKKPGPYIGPFAEMQGSSGDVSAAVIFVADRRSKAQKQSTVGCNIPTPNQIKAVN